MSDRIAPITAPAETIAIYIAGSNVATLIRAPGERGFHFRAEAASVDAIDGHVFASPRAAEQAARLHVATYHARAA